MGWVVQTLVKILLKALCGLFGNLATDFVTKFGLNIGSKFPVIGGPNISLEEVLTTYYAYGNNPKGFASAFDIMFPMFYLRRIFIIMAITVATALFAKELILAIASPLSGGQRQHPFTSTAKFIASIVAIILSYRLFIMMEYIMNQFYIKVGTISLNLMHDIDSMPTGKLGDVFTDDLGSKVGNTVATVFDISTLLNPSAAVTIGIGELILNLIVVYLIFVNFIKLILEILERYIVVGVLFYTAPLAFATLPSNDTRDIFKSWFRMSISEMFLVVTNSIFICIFIGSLGHMNNIFVNAPQSMIEEMSTAGQLSWIVYMMLLLAWLLFAQRLDSYLNSLGLSTAQTGGSLGAAVLAGAAAVAGSTAAFGGKVLNSAPLKASRMAGLNPGKAWGVAGKSASDLAKSKANQLSSAAGISRSDDKISEATKAENRNRGIYDASSIGKKVKNSNPAAAQALGKAATGQTISGDEARNAADAIATASNDRGLQKALRNAENVSIGQQHDGSLGMNIKDKNGNDLNVAIGGNMSGKATAGEINGVKLGVSGSASAMQGYVGDKQLKQDMAATSMANPNYVAGVISSGGQSTYGFKDQTTGQVFQAAPVGTIGGSDSNMVAIGASGMQGIQVGSGAQFSSLGRNDSMIQYKQGLCEQLSYGGNSEFSQQIASSTQPFSLSEKSTATIAKGLPFGISQVVKTAQCTMDPSNLTMECEYPDGGCMLLEFNPDNSSTGSVIKTDFGNMAVSVSQYGEGVMSDIRETTNFDALQKNGQDFVNMLGAEYGESLNVLSNKLIPTQAHDGEYDGNALPIVSETSDELVGYTTSSTLASGLPGDWYSIGNGMSIYILPEFADMISQIKNYMYNEL